AYKGSRQDWIMRPAMALLRAKMLSVTEHRDWLAAAGFSDVEVFEERDRGWLCARGVKRGAGWTSGRHGDTVGRARPSIGRAHPAPCGTQKPPGGNRPACTEAELIARSWWRELSPGVCVITLVLAGAPRAAAQGVTPDSTQSSTQPSTPDTSA